MPAADGGEAHFHRIVVPARSEPDPTGRDPPSSHVPCHSSCANHPQKFLSLIYGHDFNLSCVSHNTTGQEHNTNKSCCIFQRVTFPFLLWMAKSVCIMACPCGSVLVGVETLHERLSCSGMGKKVAGLRPRHSHAKLGLINARDAQCKNGM